MSKKNYLIVTTLLVGMCSIVYELLISTASSYFLGNSVKQFSLIIGFYMAFMGIGAYFAKWIKHKLIYHFILIEIILGLLGAFSVPLCYFYFWLADYEGFNVFVFFMISLIGTLTGLEVPLLTRVLENDYDLSDNISNILAFDYLGALVATIAFPFFLVPVVGIFKSSLFFGLLNISIGVITYFFFKNEIEVSKLRKRLLFMISIAFMSLIIFSIATSASFMQRWNRGIFKHPVLYTEQSPYQDITVTKTDHEFRLYLNGAIQFSSKDEYRYHEALVHIAMMQHQNPKRILLLGGGEGLAAREILKYDIDHLDIVDIDPAITDLSSTLPLFTKLNADALSSDKVSIHNEDAFRFLMESRESYDVIICDLPDPTSEALARLYSNAFYNLIQSRLAERGLVITQSTSPTLTPNAFWCIEETLAFADFKYTYPYQINVPSFGNWGFIMASHEPLLLRYTESIETQFLEKEMLRHIFYFPKDNRPQGIIENTLDQPILMEYYLDHWRSLSNEAK